MARTVVLLVTIAALVSPSTASAQDPRPSIYNLEVLRGPQVDALDRERTLFILPVGMLEVHGPHLPIGNDTIGLLYEAGEVSRRLSRTLPPQWNVVMMPPIHYGQSGANDLGGILVHPGTYAIRQSTLRSLVADVGGQVAQNGFKWIFVLNGHGAPTHNIAINEACDFISERYRVTMLHVTALLRADADMQTAAQKTDSRFFSDAARTSFGLDLHAGVSETSGMLAIRPDLVDPQYKKLPSRAGQTLDEVRTIAGTPGWQGYLSDPAKGTAAHGRAVEDGWINGFTTLILRAVRGENLFEHARFPETVPAPVAGVTQKALDNEAAFGAALDAWLAQRRAR
jgi:creatinine amidohydrolase/Fe(II)-dependent formamide hydrolase-like protein